MSLQPWIVALLFFLLYIHACIGMAPLKKPVTTVAGFFAVQQWLATGLAYKTIGMLIWVKGKQGHTGARVRSDFRLWLLIWGILGRCVRFGGVVADRIKI